MFAAAMMANATYTSAIFIRMCTLSSLWPRLPWILGSAGVLFFDTVVRDAFGMLLPLSVVVVAR